VPLYGGIWIILNRLIKSRKIFILQFYSSAHSLSELESEFSGKFSSSIESPSLALVSASTNSLLLQYFLAEYSLRIGTIFLF
jgi:hypothetical protein